ncbi:MAG: class E sortase [Actinomycetota bacterium]|nr:class E sortase [Actinomycetota bacterium]
MKALRVVGRSFIALGILTLLFLAYQLFGTNLVTGREQKALAADLAQKWQTNVAEERPDLGGGVALIRIPKIGVNSVVVEGVGVEELKKGPGHYPETAMPGELGNMVISGHRTTYGAPFYRLDELRAGDEITMFDQSGGYKYVVTQTKIVKPTEVGVIAPTDDARLTLTTCHPRFSARERLIIVAALQGTPKATGA